ncbi:MAG TPA: hypothetical protein VOA88_05105 [Candidatus Dormibacteraeota bacterium]|nr:hypothetical protein [Candidatus Dormibacteraeota bacterium]
MKPSDGRRAWVKLWTNDWLEGTTRYQMTGAQRAFWVDLLAMAGRSRFGGVICAGKDNDQWIGYPLQKFQGLLSEPIDVLATFKLFERTGKITLHVTGEAISDAESPTQAGRLYTIFITNWNRYQSEYQRTKKYRGKKTDVATHDATEVLHPKSQAGYGEGSTTEVDVDVEVEREKETEPENTLRQKRPQKSTSSAAAAARARSPSTSRRIATSRAVVEAFKIFDKKQKPFGPPAFQQIWTQQTETLNGNPDKWSDFMEVVAEACQEANVKVPGKFFRIKRHIEEREVDHTFGQ